MFLSSLHVLCDAATCSLCLLFITVLMLRVLFSDSCCRCPVLSTRFSASVDRSFEASLMPCSCAASASFSLHFRKSIASTVFHSYSIADQQSCCVSD